jgi:hypothetical protein
LKIRLPSFGFIIRDENQEYSCFFHVWNEFYLHHFEDKVDPYWGQTRVLERLNYAQRLLPQNVNLTPCAPDGTGVGHIFWYHLETNGMDLGEQRALQVGM